MPRKKCKTPKWVLIADRRKPLPVADTFPVNVTPPTTEQATLAAEMADYLTLLDMIQKRKLEADRLRSDQLDIKSATAQQTPITEIPKTTLQHFVKVKHGIAVDPPHSLILLYSALRGSCMLLIFSQGKNWLSWLTLDHLAYHVALPPPGAHMHRPCRCSSLPWDDSFQNVATRLIPLLYLTHIAAALPTLPMDLCKLVIGLEGRSFEQNIQ